MKPHEEMWSAASGGGGSRIPCVESESGGVVALVQVPYTSAGKTIRMLPETALERAKLLAAAPEMARALLVNGYVRDTGDGQWHTDACNHLNDGGPGCFASCEQARAALKKAGVL